mmetsp:Transcript_10607/g.17361  ORF Transcript_10607/g.17361 Transcript_10607/m.17361 type:complete len:307 (-) Transcript_10607:896-1816(-)
MNVPDMGLARSSEERYLQELLAEQTKLAAFRSILPNCARLLDAEISRTSQGHPPPHMDLSASAVSALLGQALGGYANLPPLNGPMNGGFGMGMGEQFQGPPVPDYQQPPSYGHYSGSYNHGGPGPSNYMKHERYDRPSSRPPVASAQPTDGPSEKVFVPVEKYPNYNFVGRILGPRGMSLKRIEDETSCRIMIRGKGSVKDKQKEEEFRVKPGYEHLNEPLHVLIEATLPEPEGSASLIRAKQVVEELMKPVEEGHDDLKRQQLRELALMNGTFRDDRSAAAHGGGYDDRRNFPNQRTRMHPYQRS